MGNGTTHVAVQRWLQGSGIKPQTAEFVAEALSGKLQRKLTLSDLGFVGAPAEAPAIGTGYAASLVEALATLDGIAQLSPDSGTSNKSLLPESEVNSAAFAWMISRPDDLITCPAATRRVGMRDVAAIRTVADTFTRLDVLYGGGHGHTTLR
ncbi:sporulation protein, partial [Streptomyces sp. MCAF7]